MFEEHGSISMDMDSVTVIAVLPIPAAVFGLWPDVLPVGILLLMLFLRTRVSNKGRNVGRHAQTIAVQTSAIDHI